MKIFRTDKAVRIIYILAALCAMAIGFCIITQHRLDYSLRYNEATCIWNGIDPYRVYIGETSFRDFVPYGDEEWNTATPSERRSKHAVVLYPAWTYPFFFLPMQAFPFRIAKWIWTCVQLLGLFLIGLTIRHTLPARTGITRDSFLLIVSTMLVLWFLPIKQDLVVGNVGIIVSAGYALTLLGTTRKQTVLVAFGWVLAMTKPHFGMLLAIPLLLDRNWRSAFLAGSVCLVSGLICAKLAGTSLTVLLTEMKAAGTPFYHGSALLPEPVSNVIATQFSKEFAIDAGLAAGLALCFCFSWLARNQSDGLRISVVALASLSWTYHLPHDCILFVIPAASAYQWASRHESKVAKIGSIVFFALCLGEWGNAIREPMLSRFLSRAGFNFEMRTFSFANATCSALAIFEHWIRYPLLWALAFAAILKDRNKKKY